MFEDEILEPIRKELYEAARDYKNVLKIHVTYDFYMRVKATGHVLVPDIREIFEYPILGYSVVEHFEPCEKEWWLEIEGERAEFNKLPRYQLLKKLTFWKPKKKYRDSVLGNTPGLNNSGNYLEFRPQQATQHSVSVPAEVLSFVACPNHQTNEGFNKLYPLGNGMFKCSLCGKEFTRERIKKEIEMDYNMRIMDMDVDYNQNLARLYADKKESLDAVDRNP